MEISNRNFEVIQKEAQGIIAQKETFNLTKGSEKKIVTKHIKEWSLFTQKIFDYYFDKEGSYICTKEEQDFFDHDVTSAQIFSNSFKISQKYQKGTLKNKMEIQEYPIHFLDYIDSVRFSVYYIQSLSIQKLSLEEAQIKKEKWATNFSLHEVLGYLKRVSCHENIIIDNLKNDNIKALEGDMAILMLNIIRNAYDRGKALNMRIFQEKDMLCFADDGNGFLIENPNKIFQKGMSNFGSTGLGLRDIEKRGFLAQASNEGLLNKEGKKGALIQIKKI